VIFGENLQISVQFFFLSFSKIFLQVQKKMFTQYTNQLMSIILWSTLVNFYLLVILYGELLLKKAAIYVVKAKK
jgi:hypothetical protein